MSKKIESRNRRTKKLRAHAINLKTNRLTVFRSGKHIYAQVFSLDGKEVLVQASTLDKEVDLKITGNADAALKVGEVIGKRALAKGIEKVAFDRSGYKYHGRVKALAEAARTAGLEF